MKAVMMSIHPKWCELIASGEKTIEVRKTRPKIDTPFKCYIYETRGQKTSHSYVDVIQYKNKYYEKTGVEYFYEGRGQVIGEFVCRLITGLKANNQIQAYYNGTRETCLTEIEIVNYAKGKMIYYWHISDLVIYDEPKGLCEYRHCGDNYVGYSPIIRKPPQSWCYAEESEVEE